jgi:hypothetical protein
MVRCALDVATRDEERLDSIEDRLARVEEIVYTLC